MLQLFVYFLHVVCNFGNFLLARNIASKLCNGGSNLLALKMMKNAFYFTLKALFVLKIFKFLSQLFGHTERRFYWKDKVIFKIVDVATWLTNNCKTYIVQCLKK